MSVDPSESSMIEVLAVLTSEHQRVSFCIGEVTGRNV